MANKRYLNLEKEGISINRQKELLNFCLQYPEMRDKLQSVCEISAVSYSGMPTGGKVSNYTAAQGELKALLGAKIEMIEQTAIEADFELYDQLMENLTQGVNYEYLTKPICSRSSFYRARRRFFLILDRKKKKVLIRG